MHHHPYIARVPHPKKNILILGESHRISKDADSPNCTMGIPATYTTAGVVEESIRVPHKQGLEFFKKIGLAFGQPMETEAEKTAFWERVCFANYIDVLCGVSNDAAKNHLKTGGNRQRMNDELFTFVNQQEIDVIVCFSRLVYNHLPSLNKTFHKTEDGGKHICSNTVGGQTDYIAKCVYLPNIAHPHTAILLRKPLTVYGLRHPSARGGFCAENYVKTLSALWD